VSAAAGRLALDPMVPRKRHNESFAPFDRHYKDINQVEQNVKLAGYATSIFVNRAYKLIAVLVRRVHAKLGQYGAPLSANSGVAEKNKNAEPSQR